MNLYFDNASTSHPKPTAVGAAMSQWIEAQGGSYGRAASQRVFGNVAMVEKCRDLLASMIGAPAAEQLFFTHNATHAANTTLQCIGLDRGDRVLVSPMEHNCVMRPLEYLRHKFGVEYEVLPGLANGSIDSEALVLVDVNNVKLVVINHISNVNGVVQPLDQIGKWAHDKGLKLMVDASQSIGSHPIDVERSKIDYLFFTGHKSLMGPTGTGGLWVRDTTQISPLVYGGTGSNSDSYDMPSHYPDRMEAGTPNITGIVGLLAAIENRPEPRYSASDLRSTIEAISTIAGAKVLNDISPLFSFIHNKLSPSEISDKLYRNYGIEVRSGLHCSPLAHRHLLTYPTGTVRISISAYHAVRDLEYLVKSLRTICL